MLHFHGRLVDHQPRADVGDMRQRYQAIGLQRVAGIHDIDNQVGQTDQRRQFHGAVQLDDLDLLAPVGVVAARALHVLGGNAQAPLIGDRILRTGNHQPAFRDTEIQRFVQAVGVMLHQHIISGNAHIGGGVLILLTLAVAYGGKRLYDLNREKKEAIES